MGKIRPISAAKIQKDLDAAREGLHEALIVHGNRVPDAVITAWAKLELALSSVVRHHGRTVSPKRGKMS